MTLFSACRLSIDDVERELKRPLQGSPSSGEIAVVLAMDSSRIEEARHRLERDGAIGADLRELIEKRVLGPLTGETKAWTVHLPIALWDEYARLARVANVPAGQCLVAAIQRDSVRRQAALDTAGALEDSVGDCRAALAELLGEARAVVQRLGAIQDLATRMTRLERAVSGLAGSR